MTREQVIKGLECCGANSNCFGCPYINYLNNGCMDKLNADALALIQEHQEQLKAREWISVEDRLPTYAELKDEYVLVLLDDGAICSTGFDECIEGESIFGEWRQNFDPVTLGATDSDWMPLEGVTHWMPLPKLPKEAEDGQR